MRQTAEESSGFLITQSCIVRCVAKTFGSVEDVIIAGKFFNWLAAHKFFRFSIRSCGNVFCWKCSNYFCPVPQEQLFGQQRVCRKCFDKLDGFLEPPETSS